jgi:hypothetical protein
VQGQETTAVSHELVSRAPGSASATTHPVRSINIRRALATVVVTLERLLDEDSSPALPALLWDRAAAHRGGSLAVVEPSTIVAPSCCRVREGRTPCRGRSNTPTE